MGDEGVTYLGPTGHQGGRVKRDKSKGDQDDSDAIDRLIAELGASGWEMVGVSNHGYLQWLYFKRPIQ
jgi:hypothetical protein